MIVPLKNFRGFLIKIYLNKGIYFIAKILRL